MTFAVGFYDISVWVHVSAVVVGFGATFAESLTFPLALKAGVQHLPYVHRLGIAINQRLASPALALIIITGIYQTADRWEFGDFWIGATFLIALILGGMNGAYFIPGEKRLLAQVERELGETGEISADYRRKAQRMGIAGAIAGVLVLLAVFFMVTKPGA
jgi:Predicted integral membrane protein (DUF2269)